MRASTVIILPERSEVEDRILDAAEALVRRFGIKKTSMGDVAKAAGVSRATLYNHFSDKEQLMDSTLLRASERFHLAAELEVAKESTLLKKVVTAVYCCHQQLDSDLYLNIRETEPETAAMLAQSGESVRRCLSFWPAHIEQALEAGELREGIDVTLLADIIQRLVLSLVSNWPSDLVGENRDRMRDYIEQALFLGAGPNGL